MRRYKNSYMNLIMTPPKLQEADYSQYKPEISAMNVVSGGLSDKLEHNSLSAIPEVSSNYSWMTPMMIGVSVFVISAFTAVTIYIIMSQMRRGR